MSGKAYRVGIDLGGTNIKVGVLDAEGRLLGKKRAKTRAQRPWQRVAADMAALVQALLQELEIPLENCEKAGIGSPGMIDAEKGSVVFAGNFGWENVPLAPQLQQLLRLPVCLANDANCAVLGEVHSGAGRGCRDIVLLTLGTGVGGGVVAGGVLQQGGAAGGMELGHTLLVMDGVLCTCGRKGCLESYASAGALARMAREAAAKQPDSRLHTLCRGDLNNMNAVIPFAAAREGDEAARHAVENYIRCLGEGIINFINVWRPQKVLLGGGVSHEGEPLLAPLNEYVRPRCFAGERGFVPPIIAATLGNDAGLYGAAAL